MLSRRSWLLIRHGETYASARGEFRSFTESDLTAAGQASARLMGEQLAALSPAAVFSSPARRAIDTARLAGFSPTLDPDLAEWNLGDLEGLGAERFRRNHPGWSLFSHGPPDGSGESTTQVRARAERVAQCLEDESSETTVIFSHGQFLRVLALTMVGLDLDVAPRLSFGPGRTAFITERAHGRVFGGWNLPAVSLSTAVQAGWS